MNPVKWPCLIGKQCCLQYADLNKDISMLALTCLSNYTWHRIAARYWCQMLKPSFDPCKSTTATCYTAFSSTTVDFSQYLLEIPARTKLHQTAEVRETRGVLTSSLFTTRLHQNLSTTLLLNTNVAEMHLRVKAILFKQLHRFWWAQVWQHLMGLSTNATLQSDYSHIQITHRGYWGPEVQPR